MHFFSLFYSFISLFLVYGLLIVLIYHILQGASAVAKRTVRESDSKSSTTSGGVDGLPREDISGKLTPTLLKSLESTDWKV